MRRQLHCRVTSERLLEEVKVETAQNADILNIIATTGGAADSARLANAFAQQYIAFRASSQLSYIATAERQLRQQLAELPADRPSVPRWNSRCSA